MSRTIVLAIAPDHRPAEIAEFRNAFGWSPSIWRRLLEHRGDNSNWAFDPEGDAALTRLWDEIEELPEWQQIPLVLTFDVGVIPCTEFARAAVMLDEFEARLPALDGHVNHVPALADLFRAGPEAMFVGLWGTSVTDNPFDPWDEDSDAFGSGLPATELYILERHRESAARLVVGASR